MYAYNESVSMWEKRMLAGRKPMPIVSYHPEIGRGCIEHEFVPHEVCEQELDCALRVTWFDRIRRWLDI